MDNNEDMGLLPLDFPEDNEPEDVVEEKIEEKTVKIVLDKRYESKAKKSDTTSTPEPVKQKTKGTDSDVKNEEKRKVKKKMPPPAKKAESKTLPIQGTFLPGQILQEGRVRADLSVDQVAQETKINKKYITSLEMGDAENLPPGIYVEAYIKQLCKVYKLDPAQVLNSMNLDGGGHKVPGEILQDIEKGKQVNFQEEARVRKFFKITGVAVIMVVVAVFLIVKFSSPSPKASAPGEGGPALPENNTVELQPEKSISSQDLEIFLAPQPFTMTELKVPE
jgi:hypothetical protein